MHDLSLRPNIHATPSMSRTIQWQPAHDVWMETALILLSERRMWGSSRSVLLGRVGDQDYGDID